MRKDLTGLKFGRLTVLEVDEERSSRKTFWFCKCDCGKIKSVRSDQLQSGNTSSCGCLKKETDVMNVSKNHKHKMTGTRLYHIWQNMKSRCYNPNDERYNRYGERGIAVCDEWKTDFSVFLDWSIKNGYSPDLTIDRIDNDKGYSPTNCRWADNKLQSNNRSTNIVVEYKGVKGTITEISEKLGLNPKNILSRYEKGDRGERLFRPMNADKRLNIGERCHLTKINEETAKIIKERLNNGQKPSQIYKELNISKHIVHDINRGKTWKWI